MLACYALHQHHRCTQWLSRYQCQLHRHCRSSIIWHLKCPTIEMDDHINRSSFSCCSDCQDFVNGTLDGFVQKCAVSELGSSFTWFSNTWANSAFFLGTDVAEVCRTIRALACIAVRLEISSSNMLAGLSISNQQTAAGEH